jgi:hypothetical protein
MSGFGADQGAGAVAVDAPRSTGELGRQARCAWRAPCKADPKTRIWEDCRHFVEDLTERVSGVRAMRCAERGQGEIKLAISDMDVAPRSRTAHAAGFGPLDRRERSEAAIAQQDRSLPDRQSS